MRKLVLIFSLYCITPSLFAQLISPNLIGGNAWLPGELGGNFEAISLPLCETITLTRS